jgi:hypothetical protein
VNLRFDTPDGRLTRSLQVLRLRQDTLADLQGSRGYGRGVHARRELEFTVSDFEAARALLSAGYQVSLMYENIARLDLDGVRDIGRDALWRLRRDRRP